MKKQLVLISLLAMVVFLAGCGRSDQPPVGKKVTVQFRRDALGSAHTLPIPPTTDSQNGAQVSLSGKLTMVNSEWIVLEHQKLKHWIPLDSVLLIRINK
jgi:hypothetical protein